MDEVRGKESKVSLIRGMVVGGRKSFGRVERWWIGGCGGWSRRSEEMGWQ